MSTPNPPTWFNHFSRYLQSITIMLRAVFFFSFVFQVGCVPVLNSSGCFSESNYPLLPLASGLAVAQGRDI